MSRILSMMRACKPGFYCKLGLFKTGIYTGRVFNQAHVHLRSLTRKLRYTCLCQCNPDTNYYNTEIKQ